MFLVPPSGLHSSESTLALFSLSFLFSFRVRPLGYSSFVLHPRFSKYAFLQVFPQEMCSLLENLLFGVGDLASARPWFRALAGGWGGARTGTDMTQKYQNYCLLLKQWPHQVLKPQIPCAQGLMSFVDMEGCCLPPLPFQLPSMRALRL